jgi:hypothetical protein
LIQQIPRSRTRVALAILTLLAALLTYWVWTENQLIEQLEVISAEEIAEGRFFVIDGRRIHVVIKGDLLDDPTGAYAAGCLCWRACLLERRK